MKAMGDAAKKLLEAAMHLPESERMEVASALWETVSAEPGADWERDWEDECERRETDSRPNVDFEAAYKQLLQALGQR